MSALLSSEGAAGSPADAPPGYADAWQRLQDERTFRLTQLTALEAEVPPSPRHESVQHALSIAASTALREVEAALARMAEGRYGRCVTCDRPIDTERLGVLPMAALCMSCHYNEQNCGRSGQV
jgi:DnaK suppressor protein